MQDDNNRSGNDTDADDADIKPIYDEEPMTEVQLTAECNIFAIEQQHTEQPEIINEGRVDQSRYDHKKPEFELEESKMEENGSFGSFATRTPRNGSSGLQGFNHSLDYCSWDSLGTS
ncbi:hypothetical protein Tco_1221196 [Tanacetum coccineum]